MKTLLLLPLFGLLAARGLMAQGSAFSGSAPPNPTTSAATLENKPEAAPHTWTDTQGRTLSAVFVEANAQEVIVRDADGDLLHLSRKLLSTEDLAFADKAQAAKPITVTIGAGRARFTSKQTENPTQLITVDSWGYNFTLTNSTLLTGQNLRAEYQLFYRRTKETGEGDVDTQPIVHQTNTEIIAKLDPSGTISFRTDPVVITTTLITSNNYWAATGTKTFVNTKFEGIWLRVFQNNLVVGEYVSSEDIRKLGWPVDTPGRRGNGRAGGAAGAGGAAP